MRRNYLSYNDRIFEHVLILKLVSVPVDLTTGFCKQISIMNRKLLSLWIIYHFVLMAVMPYCSNAQLYEIWDKDKATSNTSYSPNSERSFKEETEQMNFSESNKTEDHVSSNRASLYFASSGDFRHDNTSVHLFVKDDFYSKINQIEKYSDMRKPERNAFKNSNRKSCSTNCTQKTPEERVVYDLNHSNRSLVDNDVELLRNNQNVSAVKFAKYLSKRYFNSSKKMNPHTEYVENSRNESKALNYSTTTSDSAKPDTDTVASNSFQRISSRKYIDDIDNSSGPLMLYARSLGHASEMVERSIRSRRVMHRTNSTVTYKMGRSATPNLQSENHVPLNSSVLNSPEFTRVARLPDLSLLPETESTPPEDISHEELKKYIAQMRTSRAAGVVFADGSGTAEECQTSKGEDGICIALTECKDAMGKLRNEMPYICRWIGDMPVVCCPKVAKSRKLSAPGCGTRIVRGLNRMVRQVPRIAPEFAIPSTKSNKQPSIAGGEESTVGSWPWMAGIYTRNFGIENFLCGAAVISEKFLVTAAHCFQASGGGRVQSARYIVRVGSIRAMEGSLHFIESITIHPEYKRREHYNDIAVIRLKEPMDFTTNVRPICLPNSPEFRGKKLKGMDVTVTGWGDLEFGGQRASILREVTVKVIDLSSCNRSYADMRGSTFPQGLTSQFICAGVPEGGKDACQRDSGGPLMLFENGVWTLVGVVSFGYQCAQAGYPGVYTRITSHLKWLEEVAAGS